MLLLELPDEVLCHVLEASSQFTDIKGFFGLKAPGRQDILNFGRTCHKAYCLAEPLLLSSSIVRRSSHVESLLSILDSDPDDKKVRHVKNLALVPCPNETSIEYREIAKRLQELPNLGCLFIEIPHHLRTVISENVDLWPEFQKDLSTLDSGLGLPGRPIPTWSHRLTTCKNPDPITTNFLCNIIYECEKWTSGRLIVDLTYHRQVISIFRRLAAVSTP